MRILFLAHNHPALQPGGSEAFALGLFRALRDRHGAEGLFLAGVTARCASAGPARCCRRPARRRTRCSSRSTTSTASISRSRTSTGWRRWRRWCERLAPDSRSTCTTRCSSGWRASTCCAAPRRAPRMVATLHDYFALCPREGQLLTPDGRAAARALAAGCLPALLPRPARHRLRAARPRHARRLRAPSTRWSRRAASCATASSRRAGTPRASSCCRNAVPAADARAASRAAAGRAARPLRRLRQRQPLQGHAGRARASARLSRGRRRAWAGRAWRHGLAVRGLPGGIRRRARRGAAGARHHGGYAPEDLARAHRGGRLGRGALHLVGERAARDPRGLPPSPPGDLRRRRRHGGAGARRRRTACTRRSATPRAWPP